MTSPQEEKDTRTVAVEINHIYDRYSTVTMDVVTGASDREIWQAAADLCDPELDWDALNKMGLEVSEAWNHYAAYNMIVTDNGPSADGGKSVTVDFSRFFAYDQHVTLEADPQATADDIRDVASWDMPDTLDGPALDKMHIYYREVGECDYSITDVETGEEWDDYQASQARKAPKP